jgi:hypothetical protein
MSVIPCSRDETLQAQIEAFAEVLKTQAHTLGDHGLDERDFYSSAIFRGAIERVRGQFSATMRGKREFVQHVLNHLEDCRLIAGWDESEDTARNDYVVRLVSGRIAVIDLKGCLDGNNTAIFERPPFADEFIVWSLCTNVGADPRRNAWSGIHTRLSADMITRGQRVDGMIVWDMVCGGTGRRCPKLIGAGPDRRSEIGPFRIPPPCIYVFPATVPTVDHPVATAQGVENVELLSAFHKGFGGAGEELNTVNFEIQRRADEIVRTTTVLRDGVPVKTSKPTAIRRV